MSFFVDAELMKSVNENRSQDLKIFSQTTLCNWPYEIADHHLSENRMRVKQKVIENVTLGFGRDLSFP